MPFSQEALRRIREHWRNYLIQTGLCIASLFIIMALLEQSNIVVISSLGATAFIVFAMPRSRAARFRNTVNGHIIGLVCGIAFSLIPHATVWPAATIYAGAVGATFLLMLVTDFKHPPAAGTAMGMVDTGFSEFVILAVLGSVLALSMLRVVTLNYMRDFSE